MAKHLKTAEIFGRNARQLMSEMGITITSLAERVGIPRPAMSRALSGRENISIGRAARIAKELNVPISCLFEEDIKSMV